MKDYLRRLWCMIHHPSFRRRRFAVSYEGGTDVVGVCPTCHCLHVERRV